MSNRFKVIEGSQSRHCCFDYTVVDTTKTLSYGDTVEFEMICECFGIGDAENICEALNQMDERGEICEQSAPSVSPGT